MGQLCTYPVVLSGNDLRSHSVIYAAYISRPGHKVINLMFKYSAILEPLHHGPFNVMLRTRRLIHRSTFPPGFSALALVGHVTHM